MRCACLCYQTLLVDPLLFGNPQFTACTPRALCVQLLAGEEVPGAGCREPFRTQGVGLKPNDLFGLAAGTSGCSGHRARGMSPITGQDLSSVCDRAGGDAPLLLKPLWAAGLGTSLRGNARAYMEHGASSGEQHHGDLWVTGAPVEVAMLAAGCWQLRGGE